MNELNKLIEQYERETGEKALIPERLGFHAEHYSNRFIVWAIAILASRPTCGVEQRKFLDEVEKLKYEVVLGCDGLAKELGDDQPIIYGSDFTVNLQKVIKGK